jgi:hypothetical protein
MTPETEVIACPACKHLLRVPLDWLGTQVQCPECRATFRAPVREDGRLTEPELLSRPAPAAPAPPRRPDAMLLIPAFGLMLCGIASVLVNAALLYSLLSHPGGAQGWVKERMLPELRKVGFGQKVPPEQQADQDAKDAAESARFLMWVVPLSLAAGAVTFAGGLSIALRWDYRLAQVACAVAMLNVAHGCCLPGAVAGLWGLLMLNSGEAREHFRR